MASDEGILEGRVTEECGQLMQPAAPRRPATGEVARAGKGGSSLARGGYRRGGKGLPRQPGGGAEAVGQGGAD